jgi:hypothetical protein
MENIAMFGTVLEQQVDLINTSCIVSKLQRRYVGIVAQVGVGFQAKERANLNQAAAVAGCVERGITLVINARIDIESAIDQLVHIPQASFLIAFSVIVAAITAAVPTATAVVGFRTYCLGQLNGFRGHQAVCEQGRCSYHNFVCKPDQSSVLPERALHQEV